LREKVVDKPKFLACCWLLQNSSIFDIRWKIRDRVFSEQ
jgi:hypothetical protein